MLEGRLGRGEIMAHYIVTFFKHVLSSAGHPFKAPQEKIEIRADAPEQAMEAAQRLFASIREIPSWQHHADTVEIAVDAQTPESRPLLRKSNKAQSDRPLYSFPEKGRAPRY
jgi:hypothetical protein